MALDERCKDVNWNVQTCREGSGLAATAVLMDIRDELKALNMIFRCHNFLEIPSNLKRIVRNTTKPRKKKKK